MQPGHEHLEKTPPKGEQCCAGEGDLKRELEDKYYGRAVPVC